MSTWGELLADIRADLKDTSSTPRWPDSSLYVWAKDAIRDYSLHFPQELDVILSESGGVYPLPSNFLEDIFVTNPEDRFLETRLTRPGVKYNTLVTRPTTYWIRGNDLYLNGVTSEEVTLFYTAWHDVPTSEDDTTMELTIPVQDEELIRLFVKAKATEQIRTKQSNLDRFRPGSGARTDNPLEPETANLMFEYLRRVSQRYRGGVIKLYRTGSRSGNRYR